MKVMLVCMYYDYGEESRGISYEYATYYRPLVEMGCEVSFFDFMAEYKSHGKEGMNQALLEKVTSEKPDVVIFALYKDEFFPQTLEAVRQHSKTFCFFQDDTWRTEFTQYWGQYFDLFGTPDPFGVSRYHEMGIDNVIAVPFGSNEFLNQKLDIDYQYDVSFVGVKHPYREWIVKRLHKHGVKVSCFGRKWDNGRVSPEDMVKVFNQSRINLNISNSISYDIRYLFSSPKALLNHAKNRKRIEQQKARPFEVCGCGGFMLTYYVEGLERYYEIGEEIAIYNSPDELVDKVLYFLEHEEQRRQIAERGYQRTLQEHTFTHRFKTIFSALQLPVT